MSNNDPKDGPKKGTETDAVAAVASQSPSVHDDLLAELDDVEANTDSGFDINDANVACGQLGFARAARVDNSSLQRQQVSEEMDI